MNDKHKIRGYNEVLDKSSLKYNKLSNPPSKNSINFQL